MFDEILARRPETEFDARLTPDRREEFRTRDFTSMEPITSMEELRS